jgi:hypothetical protein
MPDDEESEGIAMSKHVEELVAKTIKTFSAERATLDKQIAQGMGYWPSSVLRQLLTLRESITEILEQAAKCKEELHKERRPPVPDKLRELQRRKPDADEGGKPS